MAMGKPKKRIEAELRLYSVPPKKGESRWRVGYADGLRKALKIIEEEKGDGDG